MMTKMKKFGEGFVLGTFLIAIALLFMRVAFAQDAGAVVPADAPAWLGIVLQYAQAIPYVGPVVVLVLKWVGLVAAIMTAVSTCAMAIFKALQLYAVWVHGDEAAATVDKWAKRILPWLQWLSIYNVQKKQ